MDNKELYRHNTKMDYVDEGYIGKTANLEKVEKIFDTIKADVDKNADSDAKRQRNAVALNLTWDKRFREVEKLFEKEFGFKKFQLICESEIVPNAFTYSGSKFSKVDIYKMPELPTEHGKKYYDASHQYMCSVWIFSSVFVDLTSGEIVAMILHEVGHNFDVVKENWVADSIATYILQNKEDYDKDKAAEDDEAVDYSKWLSERSTQEQNEWMSKISLERFEKALNKLNLFKLKTIWKLISLPIRAPFTAIIKSRSAGFWKSVAGEVYADSFASAYGYGPELINLFRKLEDEYRNKKADTFIGTIHYTTTILPSIISFMSDTHPSTQARLKRQMDDLDRIANDPETPPETRKMAKRDADLCREVYKKYLSGGGSWTRKFFRVLQDKLFKTASFDFRSYLIKITALSTENDIKRMNEKGK